MQDYCTLGVWLRQIADQGSYIVVGRLFPDRLGQVRSAFSRDLCQHDAMPLEDLSDFIERLLTEVGDQYQPSLVEVFNYSCWRRPIKIF